MEIEVLVNDWKGHRLLDSGNGRKLEMFGETRIVRSEPKAWWRPALPDAEWRKAVAIHEDGGGREGHWRFPSRDTPKEWEVRYSLKTNASDAATAAQGNGNGGANARGNDGAAANARGNDGAATAALGGAEDADNAGGFAGGFPASGNAATSAANATIAATAAAASATAAAPPAAVESLRFQLRFMDNSKQIGLFPEQSPHWRWLAANPPNFAARAADARANPPALLNLFGYTGAASLVAAATGWHVTHVDASKPAIAWGRRNAEASGLARAPLRWVLEDAVKFAQREARRGNRYDAILLDPPAFGRGPNGELWKIERDLPPLLDACRALLSDRARFVLLTVYTIDASSILCHNLLRQMTAGLPGTIRIGELAHRDESAPRLLPLSLWGRWHAPE